MLRATGALLRHAGWRQEGARWTLYGPGVRHVLARAGRGVVRRLVLVIAPEPRGLRLGGLQDQRRGWILPPTLDERVRAEGGVFVVLPPLRGVEATLGRPDLLVPPFVLDTASLAVRGVEDAAAAVLAWADAHR